jgi:hypothetical protein
MNEDTKELLLGALRAIAFIVVVGGASYAYVWVVTH